MSWVYNKFIGLLDFLNILEPSNKHISLTKFSVWASIVTLNISVWRSPATYAMSVAALATVLANYAHRYGRRNPNDDHDGAPIPDWHKFIPPMPPAPAKSQDDDDVQPSAGA